MIQLVQDCAGKPIMLIANWQGPDLVVSVSGGDLAHVGSVALAQPRPSLDNPEKISATSSILSIIGHKEGAQAEAIANTLASALNTNVVVTCGIHYDEVSGQLFKDIRKAVNSLLNELLDELV